MIVQIKGDVKYPITLDPSVWIFDDRKVTFEELFSNNPEERNLMGKAEETPLGQEAYQQNLRPPVNKSIKRFKKEQILTSTYLMPIKDFINHAERNEKSESVTLLTKSGEYEISFKQLENSYLMFSYKGKPIKEDGPVYLYLGDGTNKNEPIKGIEKIIIQ